MMDMGFWDFDKNIQALQANNGNVDAATNWVIEHGGN